MKTVALSDVKDDLSRYLRLAVKEELVITRHGRAAGVLIGFGSEDDWFDYRLENDPRFLNRIAAARASLRAGRGVRLEDIDAASNKGAPPARGRSRVRGKRVRARAGRGG
ncbi:MAG: type II toxin-antitoxin system Phd/YefM family antitoxin [Candidatus Rokubacteria bacterium]|nr:type II toxin-antitoxin system Phd/YefM family antitoxin [Candidatus Rokubacteria bacterium]